MTSLFSTHMTLGAFSGICWSAVKAAGMVSAIALGAWLCSDPAVQRFDSSKKGDLAGSKVPRHPGFEAKVSPSPPPARVKKKKSVKFDLDRNQTVEVGNWYVQTWGTGDSLYGVRWGMKLVWIVDRYLEPHGRNQLHFPQTKWIRDVPSWDAENDDGDIEMIDV